MEKFMSRKVEMHPLSQGWVVEFQDAREVFGVLGALLYFCLLVVLGVVGLVVVLIIGAIAVALLPIAGVVALVVLGASRSNQAEVGGTKPLPTDPWLSE
jgi:hypothetical protein